MLTLDSLVSGERRRDPFGALTSVLVLRRLGPAVAHSTRRTKRKVLGIPLRQHWSTEFAQCLIKELCKDALTAHLTLPRHPTTDRGIGTACRQALTRYDTPECLMFPELTGLGWGRAVAFGESCRNVPPPIGRSTANGGYVRFTKEFSVTRDAEDDWFDPVINQDTPLYVDPYLVFDDDDPLWSGAYEEVVRFFELATELVLTSNGHQDTAAWRKAERLLKFPEPKEFAFGFAMGSPEGAGTGSDFAGKIARTLDLVRKENVSQLAGISGFALFCEGIGMDRTSDILCNILKGRFIAYTQSVASRHRIPSEAVAVRNSAWNATRGQWINGNVTLPASPLVSGGILLSPERFLKEIPRVTPERFWNWAEATAAKELRDDLNYDLSQSLTRSEKVNAARRVAASRPELALSYLGTVSREPHSSYDVKADPKGLVSWLEDGHSAFARSPQEAVKDAPTSPNEFNTWVRHLAEDFKYVVEETDAWRLLWDDKRTFHRKESIAQAIAGVMWRSECRAANVDISKEVNMGRGPVDFKFSQGWNLRALLEVKFIESSHFFTGASKQLPQYLKSEQIECGLYLALGFTDADFSDDRQQRVKDTCEALSEEKGVTIEAVFVDARPSTKKSASKLTEAD